MRRLWREFLAAFWAAYDEATGEAQRRLDEKAERAWLRQEMAAQAAAYERAMRERAEYLNRQREHVKAQLIEQGLADAKTDGRVH